MFYPGKMERFIMERILVIGGSGFLGHNLILRLRRAGYPVTCFDRYQAPFLNECGAGFIAGDIQEKSLIREALKDVDVVFHLACTILPQMSNSDPYYDVMSNVGGTLQMLDAAVENKVKKVIFLSSGGTVYGIPGSVPIREDHPTNPTCSYGISKLAIEKYLRLYNQLHGLNTCSVRLANPYGPFQRVKAMQGVIPVFCYSALMDEEIKIWGDGSVRRDFIYVDDAVSALMQIMKKEELPPELNIGSGESVSINELLTLIHEITGKELKSVYTGKRDFDVPVNVLDISLAKSVLQWSPEFSLRDGLTHTVQWIRENCIN